MSNLSPNDFMIAFWRAKLNENEAELMRLKTIRFVTPETIAALEKWVSEGKKILTTIEKG